MQTITRSGRVIPDGATSVTGLIPAQRAAPASDSDLTAPIRVVPELVRYTAPGGRHRPADSVTVERNPYLVTSLFVVLAGIAVAWFWWRGVPSWSIYGGAVGVLLFAKLVASLAPPRKWEAAETTTPVAVVVPIFNEDPVILARCLDSIDAQTHRPAHVWVVDDGSTDMRAYEHALAWAATRPWVEVIHQANAGKRHAMANAFRALDRVVAVFVCVDSDTVLEPDAISAGLAPFTDPRTAAVTGTVVALNQDSGLLPSLLDLRYVNAFLYERAAYSQVGSVLCVCGSLAFWRADIIHQHLDDFLGQTFLGEEATYGDDRHLTNLSLLHGRVVLAHGAVARTAVPERTGHFLRQQVRWGRSFFREALWSLTHLSPKRAAWWISAVEAVSWAGFTVGLLTTAFVLPAMTGEVHVVDYLVWIVLAGYARSVHVFSIKRERWSRWSQAGAFALAPAYGIVHVLLLLPLRLWSLATLRSTSWGTRAAGVEVADDHSRVAATGA